VFPKTHHKAVVTKVAWYGQKTDTEIKGTEKELRSLCLYIQLIFYKGTKNP
jgi:hypothetical protein